MNTVGHLAWVDPRYWADVEGALDERGNATLPGLLTEEQCNSLVNLYPHDEYFRTRIVMGRHGFGRGEYKYFAYPLPVLLAGLRADLYKHLSPIANRWNARIHEEARYPAIHQDFLNRCHAAGQIRPTPLILEYGEGDYNCLHQDLYGEHVFPLQVAILLSRPGEDFGGGEFVMTEKAGSQQRAEVVPLHQGDAVVFTVNRRPLDGLRTTRRVAMRHGVSRVSSGRRYTVGLILHDSR